MANQIKQSLSGVYGDLYSSYSTVKSGQNVSVWDKNSLKMMSVPFEVNWYTILGGNVEEYCQWVFD